MSAARGQWTWTGTEWKWKLG